jgi:predicted DNA-binding protein (MmcQ/YjbR family)
MVATTIGKTLRTSSAIYERSGRRRHRIGAPMTVAQLKAYCRTFPGATETLYREPYNFLVYSVGGKKFAYFKTSQPERWRFSTRVAPDRFIELTDMPGVKPARYRAVFYWITIVNVSGFPADYLTELVGWSHRRALTSLSKARKWQFSDPAAADANRYGNGLEYMYVRVDDLSGADVHRLLDEHLTSMARLSPPESMHALDIDALRKPGSRSGRCDRATNCWGAER